MKSITKSIVLTGVIGFFCSVGFAQSDCAIKKNEKEAKERQYNECVTANKTDTSKLGSACDHLVGPRDTAINDYNSCESARAECKSREDQLEKITKDFKYPQMKQAVECYGADYEEPADTTRAVLMTIGGNVPTDDPNICRIDGTDNTYTKKLEAEIKKVEQYKKELNTVNEKLVTKQKEAQEKIKNLNDDRIDLKEKFEEAQSKAEEGQQSALKNMQENQFKLQEALRKANAELIDMRQKLVRQGREADRELFKNGLDSFASMKRQCVAQQEKYCKEAPNRCKKKTSKSLGGAANRGSGKVDDLTSMQITCLEALEKQRNAVMQDAGDLQVQIENNIRDRESAIADMNTQFKQQVEFMNKALEREQANLTKAQQSYFQKDQNLMNQINGLQQAAQQEQMQLTQQKNSILQDILAAQTTQGKASRQEVKAAVTQYKDYMSLIDSFGPGRNPATGDLLSGAPKCPEAWERFKASAEEFKKDREEIKSVEGTK